MIRLQSQREDQKEDLQSYKEAKSVINGQTFILIYCYRSYDHLDITIQKIESFQQ